MPRDEPPRQWFLSPFASYVPIALGVVLALPSLASGFFADDDVLVARLENRTSLTVPWYDVYRFTGDAAANARVVLSGQFPWWTAPGLHLHLIRPLSSAALALDHRLFGSHALGYHVDSLLWWLLTLLALRVLYRRLLPPDVSARALLVFAIADAHLQPYSWISARHSLVAAAPAAFGLAWAVRSRQEESGRWRWLALLAMAIGLAGGEVALGVLAFWASYELLGPERRTGWRVAALRVLPPVALGVLYLAIHRALGGGARESGTYLDPFGDPRSFLPEGAARYAALVTDALFDVPAELGAVVPGVAFGVVAALGGLGAWLLYRAWAPLMSVAERAALRWLVPGALLSTAGVVAAFPGSRELLVPDFGWAVLFAILLSAGSRGLARRLSGRGIALASVLFLHVVAPPVLGIVNLATTMQLRRAVDALAHADVVAGAPAHKRVFVAVASDPMVSMYPPAVLAREGSEAVACWTPLCTTKGDTRLTRLDAETLEIETLSGPFLTGAFERLFRAPELEFHVGDEVAVCGARVRVLETVGGHPKRIQAQFGAPLDDANLRVLAWERGSLDRVSLAVGESVSIPWSAGPLRLF